MKMKSFKYIAVDSNGKRVKGAMDATNKGVCLRYLEGKRLEVLSCVEYSSVISKLGQLNVGTVIKEKTLIFYLKQLGSLLTSGIKLIDALEILALQQDNKAVRNIMFIIHQEVYNGSKLSEAFKMYPKDFPPFLISMVQVGELTGELGLMIQRTADHIERQAALTKQITGAIKSPFMYLALTLAITVAMLLFVFPQIASTFSSFGDAQLPLVTRIFMKAEIIVRKYGLMILLVVAAISLVFMFFYKTNKKFKLKVAELLLKSPFLGKLIRMQNQIVIANTLAQLMSRGVTVSDSLSVVKQVTTNPVYQALIEKVDDNVTDGRTFALAFEESPYIDETMARMISTGERTSEIPKLMTNLATYYNDVSEMQVAVMRAAIQPILMLGVYIMVGALMMAIMLPQLQLGMSV